MAKKSSAHTLEYILLGLIREEPSHGYALYERLRNTSELSLIWQVKRSKLYYLLDKLEKDSYLTSSAKKEGAYPERKIFQITIRGSQILDEWLHSPVLSSRYVRLAFLSKLYFAVIQDRESAENLISAQLEVCQQWLVNLEQAYQKQENKEFINTQVYRFRMGQIQAMIQWLGNCRNSLPEIKT
jgi:PadR family transcriptional regulator AphA